MVRPLSPDSIQAALSRLARAALWAALPAGLWAGTVGVSATLVPVSPCVGSVATLRVTVQDLTVTGVPVAPYLYVSSEYPSLDCGSGGFNTTAGMPAMDWLVYAGIDPSSPSDFGDGIWPNDGGFALPVTLTTQGQTFEEDFQVTIPGWADADSLQILHLGVSDGPQGASGADAYLCLTYTTCATTGSMVPSFTPSPAETAIASAIPSQTPSATPNQTATASPTPVPDGVVSATEVATASPTAGRCAAGSIAALPNRLVGSGATATLHLVTCAGGKETVRILRANGWLVRTLWQGTVGGPDAWTVVWDGRDGAGRPVASGVYYAVYRDGNARPRVARLLVVK